MKGQSTPLSPDVAVASLYQEYLVTRVTGRAVRLSIERLVDERSGPSLTVIDFRDVAVIDFSCADEVVARLLHDTLSRPTHGARHYFVLDGMQEAHIDPVSSALQRRGLAVAARTAELRTVLLGRVGAEARGVWEALGRAGRAGAVDLAARMNGDPVACARCLDQLDERRLVRGAGEVYASLFSFLPHDEGVQERGSG
ncbi:MAG: hypothetical protein ACE5FP_00800 [Gemmatimonadota bacterium]